DGSARAVVAEGVQRREVVGVLHRGRGKAPAPHREALGFGGRDLALSDDLEVTHDGAHSWPTQCRCRHPARYEAQCHERDCCNAGAACARAQSTKSHSVPPSFWGSNDPLAPSKIPSTIGRTFPALSEHATMAIMAPCHERGARVG